MDIIKELQNDLLSFFTSNKGKCKVKYWCLQLVFTRKYIDKQY